MSVGIQHGSKYVLIGGPRETGSRRKNLVTNPSIETNATGWSALSSTISRDSAQAKYGAYALKIIGTLTNQGAETSVGVLPSGTYAFSAWLYSSVSITIRTDFTDDTSEGAGTADTTIPGGAWTRITRNTSVTSGLAKKFKLLTAPVTGAATWWVDGVLVEQASSSSTFFSGDTPGYAWSGTAHSSTSIQDGTRAAFNDSDDADFIGALSEITGLDAPEVRESYEDNIDEHGATHGTFYHARRPVTISGQIYNVASATDRNQKQARLLASSNAMAADAELVWIPEGYPEMFVKLRRQQPPRISGGWSKEFQLSFVAADPLIYSTEKRYGSTAASGGTGAATTYSRAGTVNSAWTGTAASGNISFTNAGDAMAPLISTLTVTSGTLVNPVIQNATTLEELAMTTTLNPGDSLVIDHGAKTIVLNTTTNKYSTLSLTRSKWWKLYPGVNDLRMQASAANANATWAVESRDAWI